PLSFHPLSDSGCARESLADPAVLAFSGVVGTTEAGTNEARALGLLGARRRLCAQRAYQGVDRAGVPGGSDRALPATDWEFAAPAQAAFAFERGRLFRDRRALAHSGGAAKSGTGQRARLSLVLLRQ